MKPHLLLIVLTAILKAQAQTITSTMGPATTMGATTTMGPATTMGATTTKGPVPTMGASTTMGPATTMGATTTMGPATTMGATTTMGPDTTMGATTTMAPATTMGPITTMAPTTTPAPGPCGAGWVENAGYCYWLMLPGDFEDGHRTECALECNLAGGSLVSIHSEEEENFCLDLIHTTQHHNTWLGGRHTWDPVSAWTWEDGTDWDFEIWHKHQPDGDDADVEYCLYTQGHKTEGGWLDMECDPGHGHNGWNCICKKTL